MSRKEVYCETCKSDQPLVEHEPQTDELNPYPWYDLTCGTCHLIITTIQIVPDDASDGSANKTKPGTF